MKEVGRKGAGTGRGEARERDREWEEEGEERDRDREREGEFTSRPVKMPHATSLMLLASVSDSMLATHLAPC